MNWANVGSLGRLGLCVPSLNSYEFKHLMQLHALRVFLSGGLALPTLMISYSSTFFPKTDDLWSILSFLYSVGTSSFRAGSLEPSKPSSQAYSCKDASHPPFPVILSALALSRSPKPVITHSDGEESL